MPPIARSDAQQRVAALPDDNSGPAMAAETAQQFEALERQAQRLMAIFTRAGYEHGGARHHPAGRTCSSTCVGESLRARTYVFTDPDGDELCLRPDLTVPTCRLHLARHPAGATPAKLLLQRPRLPLSARQRRRGATRASSARPASNASAAADREQADAATLASILRGAARGGPDQLQLRLGDLGLFSALLAPADAGALAPAAAASVLAARCVPRRAEAAHRRAAAPATARCRASCSPSSILRDPRKPSRSSADYLEARSIELIGTRSLPEITESLLAVAADARANAAANRRPRR